MPSLSPHKIVQVALNAAAVSYDRCYSYAVPDAWTNTVQVGMRVAVPFGIGNRRRVGMILECTEQTAPLLNDNGELIQLKPLAGILDEEPALTPELLSLVHYLHAHTFCTWFDAIRAVLPGGMQLRLQENYVPVPPPEGVVLTQEERNYLTLLQQAVTQREKDLLLQPDGNPERKKVRDKLVEKGCLAEISEGKKAAADKSQKMLRLSAEYRIHPNHFAPTPQQKSILDILAQHEMLSVKECAYFSGLKEAVITRVFNNLVKSGAAERFEIELLRVPRDAKVTQPPENTVLSEEQQAAYDAVADAILIQKAAAFLLYGVTGSGKTAVFEQLIALTLRQGRQALLLIPEIALTPQIVRHFESRFGNQVALIHSGLSLGQRLDTDKLIRRGEVSIVIGTRSAVFAPLPNLGLIILDEEGEHSYKSDSAPRFHAADIAKERCRTHHAALVLASATPSLESRYLAEKGVYTLLTMKQRYNHAPLPTVTVVDMNQERMNGNSSAFSVTLADALKDNLAAGKQSILLLNRRGYHTLLQCTKCSTPVYCPNCSVPMTFHKPNNSLMCHYCGHIQPVPQKCPSCGNEKLRQMGFGTQKLEEELQALLPDAKILRMDADTTMTRTAYETGFQAFARGEYDIMCGTQMIGKGLDFPNVTLVGVVSIDKALYAGDFRSYERTFSLITQVVGRSGRGASAGRAILQTAMPEHYVLNLAAQQDYDRFYTEEISMRRALMFPPICDLCVIGISSIWENKAISAADRFVQILQGTIRSEGLKLPLRVLGPVEASYGKINGKYRRRVLLKCKNTAAMRDFIRSVLTQCYADKRFDGVSIYADMNGDCGI